MLRRNREFRLLFLATMISMIGDWFSFVAVTELVQEATGRPGTAAYFYAALVLPVFLCAPLAGALIDRLDRRRILLAADLLRVPLALSLCLAAWWGSLPLAMLGMVGLGVGAAFYDPAAHAATPNLVTGRELPVAQALIGLLWGSMLVIGAGLGGLVAGFFGVYAAFAINAGSFALSAFLVSRVHRPMQEPRSSHSGAHSALGAGRGRRELRELLSYLRQEPVVRGLLLAKVGVSSANGLVGLLPALAHTTSASPVATGLLFAMRGVGALVGPVLARRAMLGAPVDGATLARSGPNRALRAIVLVCGISTLSYAAFYALLPVTPWLPLVMVLVVLAHLGGGAQWTVSTYGLQAVTPDRLRGRVLSLDYGLATLAIGVSAVVAGLLADGLGVRTATWGLAALAACYGVGWLVWTRALWRRPRALAAADPGPSPRSEAEPVPAEPR